MGFSKPRYSFCVAPFREILPRNPSLGFCGFLLFFRALLLVLWRSWRRFFSFKKKNYVFLPKQWVRVEPGPTVVTSSKSRSATDAALLADETARVQAAQRAKMARQEVEEMRNSVNLGISLGAGGGVKLSLTIDPEAAAAATKGDAARGGSAARSSRAVPSARIPGYSASHSGPLLTPSNPASRRSRCRARRRRRARRPRRGAAARRPSARARRAG